MNMTRRKFFCGVAIGLPAAVIASKLPALPALTLEPAYKFQKTISTSLPIATWRKLYRGIRPSRLAHWWDTKEGMDVMNETNEILEDLKWLEK